MTRGSIRARWAATAAIVIFVSCGHPARAFRVLPAQPEYRLRAPDSKETSFTEALRGYTQFSSAWVDLRPGMELRIENAYYEDGAPKRGVSRFVGTEVARYEVNSKGRLVLQSVENKIASPPADQPPVQRLIPMPNSRQRFQRFYSAIVFRQQGQNQGSVLLSAASARELDDLGRRLAADPGSVCSRGVNSHCAVFPEACSVALEMRIAVNGIPRTVLWRSLLNSVAPRPQHLSLHRDFGGRFVPVELDERDPEALRLPLFPGDQITWD